MSTYRSDAIFLPKGMPGCRFASDLSVEYRERRYGKQIFRGESVHERFLGVVFPAGAVFLVGEVDLQVRVAVVGRGQGCGREPTARPGRRGAGGLRRL